MRLDKHLHVVPNGVQGTICDGVYLRKLSFFSRSINFTILDGDKCSQEIQEISANRQFKVELSV